MYLAASLNAHEAIQLHDPCFVCSRQHASKQVYIVSFPLFTAQQLTLSYFSHYCCGHVHICQMLLISEVGVDICCDYHNHSCMIYHEAGISNVQLLLDCTLMHVYRSQGQQAQCLHQCHMIMCTLSFEF